MLNQPAALGYVGSWREQVGSLLLHGLLDHICPVILAGKKAVLDIEKVPSRHANARAVLTKQSV